MKGIQNERMGSIAAFGKHDVLKSGLILLRWLALSLGILSYASHSIVTRCDERVICGSISILQSFALARSHCSLHQVLQCPYNQSCLCMLYKKALIM